MSSYFLSIWLILLIAFGSTWHVSSDDSAWVYMTPEEEKAYYTRPELCVIHNSRSSCASENKTKTLGTFFSGCNRTLSSEFLLKYSRPILPSPRAGMNMTSKQMNHFLNQGTTKDTNNHDPLLSLMVEIVQHKSNLLILLGDSLTNSEFHTMRGHLVKLGLQVKYMQGDSKSKHQCVCDKEVNNKTMIPSSLAKAFECDIFVLDVSSSSAAQYSNSSISSYYDKKAFYDSTLFKDSNHFYIVFRRLLLYRACKPGFSHLVSDLKTLFPVLTATNNFVSFLNFGVWYRHLKDNSRRVYQEDLELFQQELKLFKSQNPSSFIFFRESVTQHFDTASGTGEYEDGAHSKPCIQIPSLRSSYNVISEQVLSALSLFYVPDQSVTLSRHNFHRRPIDSSNYDCTHYCNVITLYEPSWRYISLTLSAYFKNIFVITS